MSGLPKLAVIGLGLIGGSFARAVRQAGLVASITGFDTDAAQSSAALHLGVIDTLAASPAVAVANADVVLLAVPVLHTAEVFAALLPTLKPGTVVTDVGSTKQSVLAAVAQVAGGQVPPWFVAGHPIAGTEKSGVAASFIGLFSGKRVVLTPHTLQDHTALALVSGLWSGIGARVVSMQALDHDRIFAATSHLPHVLAYAFVDMLSRNPASAEIFPNAGGGFRDFTRIASSSPQMWHDIVRANAPAVTALLAQQIDELSEMLAEMRSEDWQAVQLRFTRARVAREQYLGEIE